jgi:hypothetical protein
VSGTLAASAALSSGLAMMPSPSRSHVIAAPAVMAVPSRQNAGTPARLPEDERVGAVHREGRLAADVQVEHRRRPVGDLRLAGARRSCPIIAAC